MTIDPWRVTQLIDRIAASVFVIGAAVIAVITLWDMLT